MCPLCLLPLGSESAVDSAQEGRAQPPGSGPGCRLLDIYLWKMKLNLPQAALCHHVYLQY